MPILQPLVHFLQSCKLSCISTRNFRKLRIFSHRKQRAARIISSMSNDVNHSVALHVLGWELLSITRKKAKARMMYKTLNNIGPESLTKLFHCKNETTKYNLRNISGSLCLPPSRTNSMKNSFMYDGAKLWNSIQKEIRESKSLSCFQNKTATHAF